MVTLRILRTVRSALNNRQTILLHFWSTYTSPRSISLVSAAAEQLLCKLRSGHPQLVHKLVVASGFFSHDGADRAFWNGFASATLDVMPKELRDCYLEVAPDSENLQSMFDKAVQRMRTFKDIPEDKIRSITAPTLVVCGDADVMRPEHAVRQFRLLPHAQLAILPGTDHMKVTARTSWLAPMIAEFLDAK